jgi:hypothetical protein
MFSRFAFRGKKIYELLSRENTILISGFIAGILWSILDSYKPLANSLESPLTTLFVGSIYGYFTSFGALFVADLMPHRLLRPIIPLSIGVSILYHCYNQRFELK